MENSYVSCSDFPIGATFSLDDGMVVIGCNVENALYGSTNCAERTAVFRMAVEHGGNHETAACAIVGRKVVPRHPCGACRQVLYEFGYKRVVVESGCPTDGGLGALTSIDFEKTLPYVLGPGDLQALSYSRP